MAAVSQRSEKDTQETLRQLSELNDQSVQLHQNKVQQRTLEQNLSDLKETVARLQMEEAELKHRLSSSGTSKPLHHLLKTKFGNPTQDEDSLKPLMSSVAEAANKNAEQHKLNEIYIAYRLAGCTIFNINETRIGVRFDTFYRGRYYESYYVFLDSDPVTGAASVYRHTLPYFVDMDHLEDSLSTDVREFLSKVEDHLSALVSRRQQVIEMEQEFSGRIHDVFCSLAFDFVQGSVVIDSGQDHTVFEFKLNFGGLINTKPKKMSIREIQDTSDGVTRPDLQRQFMVTDGPLVARFQAAFDSA